MEQPSVFRKLARGLVGNLKFILVFVVAILFFLFLGLYSQTQVTLRESRARDFESVSSKFLDFPEYSLTLTCPKFLLLESPEKWRAPLTIQVTSTLTTSSVVTTLPLFIVTLSSTNKVIEFTDKDGVPLVPRVVFTPTIAHTPPTVIYLHQSTSETRPGSIKIDVQVVDKDGKPITLSPHPNIEIALESGEALFCSRLYELVGTTSIFVSLVTGLLGVGWKLWEQQQQARERREREAKEQEQKAQEQRERERREQEQRERERQAQERQEQERRRQAIEIALGKVESLQTLLSSNLSEAARVYWGYSQKNDFPWQENEVRNRLQTIWTTSAPQELQSLMILRDAFPEKWEETLERMKSEPAFKSLVWGWRMLDEDWQKHIGEMLGETKREIESRSWQAILKPWRQIRFWKSSCLRVPPDIAKALELLELQRNPFGFERAEEDGLFLEKWVDIGLAIETPQPQIIIGKRGSGKTALAFHTIRNSIRDKTAFPVYVPDFPSEPTQRAQLDNLARAMARTLLYFVAFYPRSFLKQDIANRSAIAHLLGMYIGVGKDLSLQLQKAGLEPIGEGKHVFQELERLLPNISLAPPSEDGMIEMLGAARPSGFSYTIILADLSDVSQTTIPTWGDTVRVLFDLSSSFHGEPIYLKILLPKELNALASRNDVVQLEWSEEQLQTLLRNRLGVVGVESLKILCEPKEAQHANPDQRLIQAAQGLPGRLISLGNKLLVRVASRPDYPKITTQDLDEILGKS